MTVPRVCQRISLCTARNSLWQKYQPPSFNRGKEVQLIPCAVCQEEYSEQLVSGLNCSFAKSLISKRYFFAFGTGILLKPA
jgi:hypothetical protein